MKSLIINSGKYGKVAVLYDDQDHGLVSKHNWKIAKGGAGNELYVKSSRPINGKLKFMHRLIMNVDDPRILIDHKNRCGLDNTRDNLRIATGSENCHNQRLRISNTSGFKGVTTWKRNCGITYRARICVNNKVISLGIYKNPIDAALVYNEAAKKHHGKFAVLNDVSRISS